MLYRYVTGEMIFKQGDASDVAYLIVSGKVEILRHDAHGELHRLATLQAGQMFGEMGVMDHAPRNASARALSDVTLRTVTLEDE